MKVLFLDVDGVLNTSNSLSLYSLARPQLRRLSSIVEDTGCYIVLSSTWRKDTYTYFKLAKTLAYRGLRIYSETPVLPTGVRGDEIQDWLDRHPEVVAYAIVDDDSDMLDSQLRNFFQTDPDYGLTSTIAYRITHHLGKVLTCPKKHGTIR